MNKFNGRTRNSSSTDLNHIKGRLPLFNPIFRFFIILVIFLWILFRFRRIVFLLSRVWRVTNNNFIFWLSLITWVRFILHRSEEHTSELQSRGHLVCRLLLEKKKELTYIDLMTSRR